LFTRMLKSSPHVLKKGLHIVRKELVPAFSRSCCCYGLARGFAEVFGSLNQHG
jgi:hypothetical protein